MKIIYNNIIPVRGFKAINLLGVLFVRNNCVMSSTDIRHERIHTAQQQEMLFVLFYVWYVIEWIVRLILHRNSYKAYRNICFEREAYANQSNPEYLQKRKLFSFTKYLWQ